MKIDPSTSIVLASGNAYVKYVAAAIPSIPGG